VGEWCAGYAFLLLRKRWAVPSHSITPASWTNELELGEGNKGRFAGHTMVQFGLASEAWNESREKRTKGKVLFVHANLIKRITGYAYDASNYRNFSNQRSLIIGDIECAVISTRVQLGVDH